ncbi:MAG TPA: hypothetical protein VHE34_12715 [Puia sp.]|uniref:hypothetical protein n=1 Tax=Puia sp. TaxID=2045100 RepID=UPI002C9ACD19|nr:hypothetical protein [Puia sp.]HVU96085.1 hypothetical protein [Puia sp.]
MTTTRISIQSNVQGRVISRKPGRVSRLAFPVFFCILACAACILWRIHYPEVLSVRAVLVEWKGSGNYLYLKADVPNAEKDRIRSGEPVQIWLDDYPNPRFGAMKGVIRDIGSGELQVLVPAGLIAGSGAIPFRKGLKGELVITTADMRLGGRIFHGTRRVSRQ